MKITNEIIMIAIMFAAVAGALLVLDAAGVASEPLACNVGPMEASQCRAEGRLMARSMWEVTP
jgi:hypothetical protein